MGGFIEQLMLAEMAAENIYFARVNRDLIESLHKRMRGEEEFLSTFRCGAELQTARSPVVFEKRNGG